MSFGSRVLIATCIIVAFVILLVGSIWAYTRGGNDFLVFYEAWKLVISGRGLEIYRVSPDRFLYSPGFAVLLAPLALFSKSVALGIWCFVKIALVFLIAYEMTVLSSNSKQLLTWKNVIGDARFFISLGMLAGAIILVARPILIDFEYGQVNFLILGVSWLGLMGHFLPEKSGSWDFVKWATLTCAAIAKLFPLPILLVPWLVTKNISPKKIRIERTAVVFSASVVLFLPLVFYGLTGFIQLFLDWQSALIARGMPMESHNQSFTALLHHYLSGVPTWIHSEGMNPILLGKKWLTENQITLLSFSWSLISFGVLLGWIISSSAIVKPLKWIAILIGLLILPSHLVWKPYFVMGFPLAFSLIQKVVEKPNKWLFACLFIVLFGINFTGFDFVGHHWGAVFEAASVLLLMHLALLVLTWVVV